MHGFIFRLSLALGIVTAFSICTIKTVKYLNANPTQQTATPATAPHREKLKSATKKMLYLAKNPKFWTVVIPSLVILCEIYSRHTGKENPAIYLFKKIWNNLYKKPMTEIDTQNKFYAECLNNSYLLGKNGTECNSANFLKVIDQVSEQTPQLLRQAQCLKDSLFVPSYNYSLCNSITPNDLITLHQLALNADVLQGLNAEESVEFWTRLKKNFKPKMVDLSYKILSDVATK